MRKSIYLVPILAIIALFALTAGLLAAAPAYAADELSFSQTADIYYCGKYSVTGGEFVNFATEGFSNPVFDALTFYAGGSKIDVTPADISPLSTMRVNAPGEYDFTVKLTFGGQEYELSTKIKVKKPPLNIKATVNGADSATIKEGESYRVDVVYEGFVGTDGVDTLDAPALIGRLPKLPTENFFIVPYMASSTLYELIYEGAYLTITADPIKTITHYMNEEEIDLTLIGNFSPCYRLSYEDIGVNKANVTYAAINEKVERYYGGNNLFESYKQVDAFNIELYLDENIAELSGPVTVRKKIDEKLSGKKEYKLIQFAEDGTANIINAVEDDGVLVFNTVGLGDYVLLIPIEGMSTAMLVGICVGVAGVLVLLILLFTMFRRKY